MTDDGTRTDAYRSGRVYAVLEVLQRLSPGGGARLGEDGHRARTAEKPLGHLRDALASAGKFYMEARRKHPVESVDTVFGMLPDAMPVAREFPGSLDAKGQAEFLRGREEQMALIEKTAGVR
ncbi:hypothetical protein [Streptomyces sp. NBC_00102]|uniref:hypothetical protein n=1 Tax=Streptomyces sp. NBC_00102 TaxID=2975652 RepID=UPI0022541035|nr:hypothetical protein [Streptomyces sp. NBC_00102]MCX5397149.1 hypothetical protein [Streptomyces sp. NBC_00102]